MREILFRGKRKDNGEWVEGRNIMCVQEGRAFIIPTDTKVNGYHEEDGSLFITTFYCEVIPETVGQYTGLTDKNGKKIFEGDIVDVLYDVQYVGVAAKRIGAFSVVFDKGCFMKRGKDGLFHFIPSDVHTVIGNIHDNPELLEVHNA